MRSVIIETIAEELNWETRGIKRAVQLIDDDNNLHFIARYRKDQTQGLTSEQLRIVNDRLTYLRKLEKKKSKALKKLKGMDVLSPQLQDAILAAMTLSDISEILQPYRSARKTRARKARDKGLQPLADIILGKKEGKLRKRAQHFVSKNFKMKNVLQETLDIVAEETINHPHCKRIAERELLNGKLKITYLEDLDEEQTYRNLQNIDTKPNYLSPHQVHAIFRAEAEGVVRLKLQTNKNKIVQQIKNAGIFQPPSKYLQYYRNGLEDGVRRLLVPRAKRSVRKLLKEKADIRALEVFKENLENLLLTPPISPQVILSIDPGYASGCKIAVINEQGTLLTTNTIYPTPPTKAIENSEITLAKVIDDYQVKFIAIGNGTASNETLHFVKHMIHKRGYAGINFGIVPEHGASAYSASPIAEREFPHLPSEIRGAISIGRRVLDPLAEYVKIDPKSLGVGQYQYEINPIQLDEALTFVVEKCVNKIGLNLRTASEEALKYISGLSATLAGRIVKYRTEHSFTNLESLYLVNGIGFKTFELCAGFLKLPQSENLLDSTLIHPDHYNVAREIIRSVGKNIFSWNEARIQKRKELMGSVTEEDFVTTDIGLSLIRDIIEELVALGSDPRGKKEFVDLGKTPSSIEELQLDMILKGEIRNVVDFGAFVDLGIKENGLIHISNLAERFVSNVHSIVKVGDKVKVKIIDLDLNRKRIGLKLLEVNDKLP